MPKVLQHATLGVIYIEEDGFRPVVTPEFYSRFPDLGDFPKSIPACVLQVFDTRMYWEGAELRLLDNGWMEKGHATVFTPELPYTTKSCVVHMTEEQFKEWECPKYVTQWTLVIHGSTSARDGSTSAHDGSMTKRVLTHKGTVELHNTTCLDGFHVPLVQVTYTLSGSNKRLMYIKGERDRWVMDGSSHDLACFIPIVKRYLVDVGLDVCTLMCSDGMMFVKRG
jgi:hypothetical protein